MRLCFIIALGVAIVSCDQNSESKQDETLTDGEKLVVQSEVKDLLNRNFQSISQLGYTAELNSLYNSPEFYWVPPRRSLPISYDSVARILYRFTPGYKSTELVWEKLHIQPLTSEIATYTGRFNSTYTDTTGHVEKYNMMEIGVVRKIYEEWKIVAGQTSVSPDQQPN